MLEELKKNLSRRNIVAYIIFGAIILVFVFFGYQTGGPGMMGYAARVNKHTISIPEFQESVRQLSQFYAGIMGGQMGDSEAIQAQMRNSALDQLIQKEVVKQGASKEGYLVTNLEIRDFLMNAPVFQKEGVFQRSYYEGYLQNMNTTAARFEEGLRRDLLVQRVRSSVSDGFEPFDSELTKIQKLRSKTYTVEYIKLDEETLKGKSTLEEFGGKTKNSDEFNSEVRKLGLKWTKASPISMEATFIPEIGASERVLGEVFKLTEKNQVVPEVLSTAQGQFAVRLVGIEEKPTPKEFDAAAAKNQISDQRANEFLSRWSSKLAENFSIEKNTSLIGN